MTIIRYFRRLLYLKIMLKVSLLKLVPLLKGLLKLLFLGTTTIYSNMKSKLKMNQSERRPVVTIMLLFIYLLFSEYKMILFPFD